MNQKNTSSEIIQQLINMTAQLENEQFSQPLKILSGNTIGKHIRHIIEFYDCLLRGYQINMVDYDKREHNPLIENNKFMATDEMKKIISEIENMNDKTMTLTVSYGNEKFNSLTSFNRELVYNIEHAIHHMAIIKIAIDHAFPFISLPKNFGVAYSTVKFQEEKCAQ